MTRVPRLWPNRTIVCLATGPSLTLEDCAFVQGKAPVIAINDAHRLAPWADVLYSSDRQWWPHYHGVPSFSGLKYGLGCRGATKKIGFATYPAIDVLLNTGEDGLEMEPTGLRNGRNSGYAAINLAVHFGARRIVLLGYNMSQHGGRSHFFGDHPSGLASNPILYPVFLRAFETLVQPLLRLGIEVVNCTPRSALTCFPQHALRDVVAEVAA